MSNIKYSEAFKANAVQKYWHTQPRSFSKCAKKIGIASNTLENWVRNASFKKREHMTSRKKNWTPTEKLQLIFQAEQLSEERLGEFLRKNGIYEETFEEWKKDCLASLGQPDHQTKKEIQQLKKENKQLKKEVNRKDRALAESTALLVLSKKFQALWGDEGDNT